MPNATVKIDDTEKHDLKTLEGGFVVLRRMTYGEKLQRRQIAMQMEMQGKGKDAKMSLDMQVEQTALFEFSKLVVEHNLEDETGRNLNLGSPVDLVKLDPRIGDEIEALISDMNDFDSEGN